ncbi:MAG: chemotaxis protein CheW [Proteobacteria bacterium]|nr:chemotaxis protein CheW [Pseudomonadota bacterium]NOG58962.1 chemotaxis protein CheW [Pseudomonadota bacterium]
MYLDKTEYKTNIDLGLYIESLLKTDESESSLNRKADEKLETFILNDLFISEDVSITAEQKVDEQPTIPVWGQEPFKCLLVKSGGMNLMIPAMSVSYIERINKKINRLPLEVEALRGVLTLRDRTVAVIDLCTLISENGSAYKKSISEVDEHHIEHVLVMENGAYALACDVAGEMIMLEPESIRWNKASFNNPMFTGIVPDYLCPIINIDNVKLQVEAIPFVQSLNKNY